MKAQALAETRQGPPARTAPLGERMLVDAAQRAVRRGHPLDTFALVLHLSRLQPPAPLPHHQRIARAILQHAAQQRDGQVFPMVNGDLALICRSGPTGGADDAATLTDQLSRLFRLEAGEQSELIDEWDGEAGIRSLLGYAVARLAHAEAHPLPQDAERGAPAAVESAARLLSTSRIDDLLQRQVGVLIRRVPSAQILPLRPL